MALFLSFLLLLFIFSIYFNVVFCEFENFVDDEAVTVQAYMFWPQATVPFYINPKHFDHTQSLAIMNAIAYIAFKTCLKFVPVQDMPKGNEHVLVFENPEGTRKCVINTGGNSVDEPHKVTLGYDCLKAPEIDMMVLRALGFPFEHNRSIRDVYIDVQPENFEPSVAELFAKEYKMPLEFRTLPYDINSVMHFGDREYSKNGHRTFIIKDPTTVQKRGTLTGLDIRKIELVYGPECRKRERSEKIELCQNIPDVNMAEGGSLGNDIPRMKREATNSEEHQRDKREIGNTVRSLRVNPDITPPPTVAADDTSVGQLWSRSFDQELEDLGIKNEVEGAVEEVYKLTGVALEYARNKHCNQTKPSLRTIDLKPALKPSYVSDIVWAIVNYTKSSVDKALLNLTQFCEDSESIHFYQRASCPFFDPIRCPKTYRSTKTGPLKPYTQHRPVYKQSTKHQGEQKRQNIYDSMYRSRNDSAEATDVTEAYTGNGANNSAPARRKRDAVTPKSITEKAETDDSNKKVKKNILSQIKHNPHHGKGKHNDTKSKSKGRSLKIHLPLSFGNATAKGWYSVAPSNHTNIIGDETTVTPNNGTEFRAQNATGPPKSDLRMGTTVIHVNKAIYAPVYKRNERKKREVDSEDKTKKTEVINEESKKTGDKNEKTGDKNEETKKTEVLEDKTKKTEEKVSKGNDTRRFFQSRRFRASLSLTLGEPEPEDPPPEDPQPVTNNEPESKGAIRVAETDIVPKDIPKDTVIVFKEPKASREGNLPEDTKISEDSALPLKVFDNADTKNNEEVATDQVVTENSETEAATEQTITENVLRKHKHKKKTLARLAEINKPDEPLVTEDEFEITNKPKHRFKKSERQKMPFVETLPTFSQKEGISREIATKNAISMQVATISTKKAKHKKRHHSKKVKHKEAKVSNDAVDETQVNKETIREYPESKETNEGHEEDFAKDLSKMALKEWDQSQISLEDKRRNGKDVIKEVLPQKRSMRNRKEDTKSRYERKERKREIDENKEEDRDTQKRNDDREERYEIPAREKDRERYVDERNPEKDERDIGENIQEENEGKYVMEGMEDADNTQPPVRSKAKRPIPKTIPLSKKNIEFYRERAWPDGVVYFIIKEDKRYDADDVRARLNEVNEILKEKTCTRIEEIKEEDVERYEDFVVLDDSPDFVTGRVGGRQNFGVMELLKGGQHRQHAAMMIMSMLGFYFEVSRHDRDKYIRVHLRHVRPDKLHHFEKIRDDATFDLPYDYKSATHPAWQFWRQVGRTGISTVATYKEQDSDGALMKSLGQNKNLLSDTDLIKINSVYGTECFGGEPSPLFDDNDEKKDEEPKKKKRDDREDDNGRHKKKEEEDPDREEQEIQERARPSQEKLTDERKFNKSRKKDKVAERKKKDGKRQDDKDLGKNDGKYKLDDKNKKKDGKNRQDDKDGRKNRAKKRKETS